MSDTIRECFAYNQRKQRCDMPAGHPGDHSITTTWSDDECYDPTAPIEVTLKEYGSPRAMGVADGHAAYANLTPEQEREVRALGPVPIYGQDTPGRCVLCTHRMHATECPTSGCDCRAGIEG